jgi:hypothetical protein
MCVSLSFIFFFLLLFVTITTNLSVTFQPQFILYSRNVL